MRQASYVGYQEGMDAFDRLRPKDNAYFSIWRGTDLEYAYAGDDREEGTQILSDTLTVGQKRKTRSVITIKFHPATDNGYITNKSKTIGKIDICPYDAADDLEADDTDVIVAGARPGNVSNAVWSKLGSIETMLSGQLEERLKLLENPQPAQVSGFNWPEQIGALLQQPGAVETIGNLLQPLIGTVIGLVNKVVPVMPQQTMPMQNLQVSGAEPKGKAASASNAENCDTGSGFTDADNEAMDNAITRLSKVCDTVICLPKLADVAEKNPALFKSMLETLMAM